MHKLIENLKNKFRRKSENFIKNHEKKLQIFIKNLKLNSLISPLSYGPPRHAPLGPLAIDGSLGDPFPPRPSSSRMYSLYASRLVLYAIVHLPNVSCQCVLHRTQCTWWTASSSPQTIRPTWTTCSSPASGASRCSSSTRELLFCVLFTIRFEIPLLCDIAI